MQFISGDQVNRYPLGESHKCLYSLTVKTVIRLCSVCVQLVWVFIVFVINITFFRFRHQWHFVILTLDR